MENRKDGAVDESKWSIDMEDGEICLQLFNDAATMTTTISIERAGVTVTAVFVDGVEYVPRS